MLPIDYPLWLLLLLVLVLLSVAVVLLLLLLNDDVKMDGCERALHTCWLARSMVRYSGCGAVRGDTNTGVVVAVVMLVSRRSSSRTLACCGSITLPSMYERRHHGCGLWSFSSLSLICLGPGLGLCAPFVIITDAVA